MEGFKVEGRLGFNRENGRYGLLVTDLWEVEGFHCGQRVSVKIAGEWVDTRFEMNPAGQWYLVGIDLQGEDLEFLKARV